MNEGCSFVFDPEEEESSTIPEKWYCPHEPLGNESYCVFHINRGSKDIVRSSDEITDSFLDGLNSENSRHSQFIGLSVEKLDLSEVDLHSVGSDSIDLRHATIDLLDLTSARVDDVFRCDDSEINEIRAPVSEFLDRVRLCGCQFDLADFQLATFERYANFNQAIFGKSFFGSASFERVRFNECQFKNYSSFHQTTFKEWTDFGDAEFLETANFSQARFDDDVTFTRATFSGKQCTFKGSRFLRKATFRLVKFKVPPDFANIDCQGVHEFQLRAPETNVIVSFRNANLIKGTIALVLGEFIEVTEDLQYDLEGEMYADFTDANLGDVDLQNQIIEEDVDVSGDVTSYKHTSIDMAVDFDKIRFMRTTFDGFDFSNYHRSLLECDWKIHRFNDTDAEAPLSLKFTNEPSIADLEETYLKAKNGARDAGDNRAASEFFLLEMRQRRAQHLNSFLATNPLNKRLQGVMSTIANDLFYISAGYGERPSRVIGISVGIVVLFTALYQGLFSTLLAGPQSWTESLLFSFQSFISFMIGSPPTGSESIFVRGLSAFEGFLGAFLIALFVFTLTRSVHR